MLHHHQIRNLKIPRKIRRYVMNTPEVSNIKNDPYDLEKLRLTQDFASMVGVKKRLVTVPVRKPHRQSFVRVHPDPAYRLQTAVLEMKEDRETYLVSPSLWSELPGEITPKELFTAIDRQGNVFLWPVRLPSIDGRIDEWSRSALEAAQIAMKNWVRVASNLGLGAYEVYESTADIPDPEWPEYCFRDLLEIAFKDRYIQTPDNPILRRLREGL
jgi:hypothetical protein